MGGGASSLLRLKVDDMIRIEYDTKIGEDDVQTGVHTNVQVPLRKTEGQDTELRRL